MMRLDPDDFGDTAAEHSGPCNAAVLCDACRADFAILPGHAVLSEPPTASSQRREQP